MSAIADLLSWVALATGGLVLITGAIGLLRFPDFYTRLHAASVIDTLGCILIVFGLLLQAGIGIVAIKLLLILVFILFTTPTAAHALARAAQHGKLKPVLHKTGEPSSKS